MAKKHILLIEDDPQLSAVVKRMMELRGYEVTHASNGREGLEALKKKKPDLIWLDLYMPELDGFGFMDEFRQHADYLDIPVLVASVSFDKESIMRRATGANIVGYYMKSNVSLGEIIDAAQDVLSQGGRQMA